MKDKSNISSDSDSCSFKDSYSESDEEWLVDDDVIEYDLEEDSEEDREYLEYQERKKRRRKEKDKEKEECEIIVNNKQLKRITAKDFILNRDFGSEFKLQTLKDLIKILDHKDSESQQKELVSALHELDHMVGMKHLKQQIMNQILFFIQDLHEPGTFLHTVITGNPGTGKTSLTYIMSKIYRSLGFLKTLPQLAKPIGCVEFLL